MELTGKDGSQLVLGSTSIGGGAIELIEIDTYPIYIKGDFNTVFLYLNKDTDLEEIKRQAEKIIIEEFRMKESSTGDGSIVYLETRENLTEVQRQALLEIPQVAKVRYTSHVLPVLSRFRYENIPFRTAAEALAFGKENGITRAGELGILYEMARSG